MSSSCPLTARNCIAEVSYNGLGQRLSMSVYQAGVGLSTQYTVDPLATARPLVAEAQGQAIFYLYGNEPLGEQAEGWSYSLADGTGTPRQLVDAAAQVTLSGRYTPWGELMQVEGQGDFTWGYFGGLMDAATGLIYLGNGQYGVYPEPAEGTRRPGVS